MRIIISIILLFIPIVTESQTIRAVEVSGANGSYVVSGEVKAAEGDYYYTVEDGHQELINEQQLRIQSSRMWVKFSLDIQILEESLPKNGSLLLPLYQKNSKGEIVNLYPVLLERFHN